MSSAVLYEKLLKNLRFLFSNIIISNDLFCIDMYILSPSWSLNWWIRLSISMLLLCFHKMFLKCLLKQRSNSSGIKYELNAWIAWIQSLVSVSFCKSTWLKPKISFPFSSSYSAFGVIVLKVCAIPTDVEAKFC